MTDRVGSAWDVFVDSLDPKTIRVTEAPAVGVVLRERPGGARHRHMLEVHELNRARFLDRHRTVGDLGVVVAEADGWDSRRYRFEDWQLAVASAALGNRAAA